MLHCWHVAGEYQPAKYLTNGRESETTFSCQIVNLLHVPSTLLNLEEYVNHLFFSLLALESYLISTDSIISNLDFFTPKSNVAKQNIKTHAGDKAFDHARVIT